MLVDYQQRVRFLLADESFERINDFTVRRFINEARAQIAGEAECIPNFATLAVTDGSQSYNFSDIELSAPTVGLSGVLNVRRVLWKIPPGPGLIRMTGREWQWFLSYVLNDPSPAAGQPRYWAQYGQGVAGTIWINLVDQPYTLRLDTVCLPGPLVTDQTVEALPWPWTDAVPYYASYLTYAHLQDAERATTMYKLYQVYMQKARSAATPSVLPHQFVQGPDVVAPNRLGVQPTPARGQ